MYTYAHPLVTTALAIITCAVIFTNAIIDRRAQTEPFPFYKPRPSLAETRRHDMLVGKWAGVSPIENGGQRQVLVERSADGTFTATFRTLVDSDRPVVVEQQIGQWGIAGPVYFTITTGWGDGDHLEFADLGRTRYYNAYRIVDLSADVFKFKSFTSDAYYILRRVPAGPTPYESFSWK